MQKLLLWLVGILTILLLPVNPAIAAEQVIVDVCVYGGTSGGVMAATATAKEGKSVILIEPGRHLGGMTSGGLGQTDYGNKTVIGGMARKFYKLLGLHYNNYEAWNFEPSAAEKIFDAMATANNIMVIKNHRLASVQKSGTAITKIVLDYAPTDEINAPGTVLKENAVIVESKVFIDTSYEGDLMAKAGVKYTVGRESVRQYGETLNGVRAKTSYNQFEIKISPYVKKGVPSTGLLPLIQEEDKAVTGNGDDKIQAYNFRLCLTKDPNNILPIKPPEGYNPQKYEIIGRYLNALTDKGRPLNLNSLFMIDQMPNNKFDINNKGAISTDYVGMNYDYPDGDYTTRAKIWHEHLDYIRGLLYYLATDEKVPNSVKEQINQMGLCKDEFPDTAGWPHQLYIREARRMLGREVITQTHIEHKTAINDSIGMASYQMDSHNCQRIVLFGTVINEGDVQVPLESPFQISYKAITPKEEECKNLLVPVALSASHIAYGSIRMEPVYMILGESAGYAACAAIDEASNVQDINIKKLQEKLRAKGQVLE